jgi:hypothetical protein
MTKKLSLSIFGVISLAVVIYSWIVASHYPSPLIVAASNILSAILAPLGFLAISQAMNMRFTEGLQRLYRLPEIEGLLAKLHQTEEAQKSKEKELAALGLVIKREVRRLTLKNQKKTLEETIERLGGELEIVKTDLSFLEESDAVIVTEEMQRMINRIRGFNDKDDFLDVSD